MKSKCHGKLCAKYLEYRKNTYDCNKCKCKGYFAKYCPNTDSSLRDDKSDRNGQSLSN